MSTPMTQPTVTHPEWWLRDSSRGSWQNLYLDALIRAAKPLAAVLNWDLDVDTFSGGVEWHHRQRGTFGYATPFWDGEDGISIQYIDDADELEGIFIPFPTTTDINADAAYYVAVVTAALTQLERVQDERLHPAGR